MPYSRVMRPVAETYMQLASDTTLAPNTKNLSEVSRMKAWKMAQEISDDFMAMQEDNIAYFTSLDAEYYVAADREMQFALQVGDRLVRVMKYFHPTSDVTKALGDRLTDTESGVKAYERNLVALGGFAFCTSFLVTKARLAILVYETDCNTAAVMRPFSTGPGWEVDEVAGV